jgi:hypothetical protein
MKNKNSLVFFSHNLHHEDIFQNLSDNLLSFEEVDQVSIFVCDESQTSKNHINLSREVKKYFNSIRNLDEELSRILISYPEFNINKAILVDRDVSFMPKFLGNKKAKFDLKQKELIAYFMLFEQLLDGGEFDYIFSELIIGMVDSILYEVSKNRGVKYISIRSSRMFPGFIFSNPYNELPLGFDISPLKKIDNKAIFESVNNYISNIKSETKPHKLPHYMQRSSRSFKLFDFNYIKKFFKYILDDRINIFRQIYYQDSIFKLIHYRLIKYKNILLMRYIYSHYFSQNRINDKRYFLFPLQYQPEATSSVRSFPFIDQVSLIKFISTILPHGSCLFVKEHFGNEGYRKPEDYKEIYYLPNVYLIDRKSDTRIAIQNSLGVITLNSTLGLEALCAGKPVAAFGNGFWTPIDCVVKCKSIDDLKEFFENIKVYSNNVEQSYSSIESYLVNYAIHIKRGMFLSEIEGFSSDENLLKLTNEIVDLIRN